MFAKLMQHFFIFLEIFLVLRCFAPHGGFNPEDVLPHSILNVAFSTDCV